MLWGWWHLPISGMRGPVSLLAEAGNICLSLFHLPLGFGFRTTGGRSGNLFVPAAVHAFVDSFCDVVIWLVTTPAISFGGTGRWFHAGRARFSILRWFSGSRSTRRRRRGPRSRWTGGQIAVIPGFFNLTYVRNTGVAFGMLEGRAFWWRFSLSRWCAWRFFSRGAELGAAGTESCRRLPGRRSGGESGGPRAPWAMWSIFSISMSGRITGRFSTSPTA